MRFVIRLLIGLVVLLAVLLGVGLLLPRNVEVSRTVTIDAPPEEIFPHINSLERGAEWSPWLGIDPDVQTRFSGPAEGVGSRLDWTSDDPQVGTGSQEIVVSEAPSLVRTDLDFGPMGLAQAWFDLAPQGEATEVTWGLQTDMGAGPVGRWMGLMMDRWVGADYERGLQNLKALVEAG